MCAIVKTCHNFQKAYHLLRMWFVLSPYVEKARRIQPFKSSKWAESIDQHDLNKQTVSHLAKETVSQKDGLHVSHPPCRRRVAANPIPSQPPRWSCNWRPEPRTAWCRATWPQRTEDGTWVKMASIFWTHFIPRPKNLKMSKCQTSPTESQTADFFVAKFRPYQIPCWDLRRRHGPPVSVERRTMPQPKRALKYPSLTLLSMYLLG